MKDRIINILTRNTILKMISLGVSFILWLVVVNYDDPTITKSYSSIPVELINSNTITDAGKVFELAEDSNTVNINVKAKRSVHNNLSRDDFRATADLSKVDENGTAPVEVKATRQADRIDTISFKGRNTVSLLIEDYREKQFNIQIEITGEPGEEHRVGSTTMDRNIVKVSGPQSKVDEVAYARATVDISGMTQDMSTTEDIELFDTDGRAIKDDDLVLSRTSVGVTVQLWGIKSVPVTFGYTGEPADGFGLTGSVKAEPSSVRVTGTAAALEQINGITIPAADVDITGAVSNVEITLPLKDYLSTGVFPADDDAAGSVTVSVGVSKLDDRTIEVPVSNVGVVNVPEGMQATVGGLGDMMALKVRGLGSSFEEFNPLLVVGIIDVAALNIADENGSIQPGVYEAPILFTYPEGITDGGNRITAQLILRNEADIIINTEEEGD